jgi:transposase
MMTVKQFAESRGISVQTVYTWIGRKQEKKNGFKVIKIGSVTMIKELKTKETA